MSDGGGEREAGVGTLGETGSGACRHYNATICSDGGGGGGRKCGGRVEEEAGLSVMAL